jgi:hypothetical protein
MHANRTIPARDDGKNVRMRRQIRSRHGDEDEITRQVKKIVGNEQSVGWAEG